MKSAIETFDKHECVDIQTVTVDSYSRLNQVSDLVRIKNEGKLNSLNGYPALIANKDELSEIKNCTDKPLQIRHGSPHPKDLWDATKHVADSFEGGPLGYTIPYSRDASLKKAFSDWAVINREVASGYEKDRFVERELFGALSSVVIAPEISIFTMLIEAKLAVSEGLVFLTYGMPLNGQNEQDLAALKVLRKISNEAFGDSVTCAIASYQWMGVFPRTQIAAERLIRDQASLSALAGVDKIIVKTAVEGFRIPRVSDNTIAALWCKEEVRARESRVKDRIDYSLVELYEATIYSSVVALMESVDFENLTPGSVLQHLKQGLIDVPYAVHERCNNLVRCARDTHGGVAVVDAGRMAFNALSVRRANEFCCVSSSPADRVVQILKDINHIRDKYEESDGSKK